MNLALMLTLLVLPSKTKDSLHGIPVVAGSTKGILLAATVDSSTGSLVVPQERIPFKPADRLDFIDPDTLIGPITLLRSPSGQWKFPNGILLVPAGNVRYEWEHPPFRLRGDSLCHDQPVWMHRTSDSAHWDSVCFSLDGQFLRGRLLSEWAFDASMNSVLEIRDPGEWIRDGHFVSPPRRVVLKPCSTKTDKHRSTIFSWIDSLGQDLSTPKLVDLDATRYHTQEARCGWLRCGVRPYDGGEQALVWVAIPGSSDTLRPDNRDRDRWKALSRNSWDVSKIAPLRIGPWSHSEKKVKFQMKWSANGPTILPYSQDLRWKRGRHVWRIQPELDDPYSTLGIPAATPPSRLRSDLVWVTTPPLFQTTAGFHIQGLGQATWTGTYRWSSEDTLFAKAMVVADKNRVNLLGAAPIPIEIAVPYPVDAAEPPGNHPSDPQFRISNFEKAGDGTLARITSDRGLVVVEGNSRFWSLASASRHPWRRTAEPPESNPHRASANYLYDDGHSIRRILSTSFHPDSGLGFDTGTAPVLSRTGGITFAVSDVQLDTSPLPLMDRAAWFEKSTHRRRGRSEYTPFAGNPGTDRLLEDYWSHAFLDAFVKGWNEHRPVRISPDAVWMQLLQGLASRISAMPETCRGQLVSHEGKKTLRIALEPDHLWNLDEDSTWARIAQGLLDSLSLHVKNRNDSVWLPSFTTTTPTRSLATRMQVLQMHRHFFDYRAFALCGIPRITLEGTPEDWRTIRDRVTGLGICGLEDWAKRMPAVLDEFVRASEGRPSRSFWRSFVRYTSPDPMCGSAPRIDGWITSFFPVGFRGESRSFLESLDMGNLPEDRGTYSFTLETGGQPNRTFLLESGFSGIGQSSDGALFPELGWSAWEAPYPTDAAEE